MPIISFFMLGFIISFTTFGRDRQKEEFVSFSLMVKLRAVVNLDKIRWATNDNVLKGIGKQN